MKEKLREKEKRLNAEAFNLFSLKIN